MDSAFLSPGRLVDGELSLVLVETGFRGPEAGGFPFYRFHMVHTDTGEAIGRITLRIGDAGGVLRYPGHVGFDVDEEHRRRQYAARSTVLLFQLAKAHGLRELWIGCSEDNVASRKTCERIGGVLVETIPVPEGIDLHDQGMRSMCRYRVSLSG